MDVSTGRRSGRGRVTIASSSQADAPARSSGTARECHDRSVRHRRRAAYQATCAECKRGVPSESEPSGPLGARWGCPPGGVAPTSSNKNRFVLLITSMRPLDAPASLDPDAVTELVVAAGIRGRVTRTFTVVNLFTSFNAPPKLPSSDASFLSGPVPHFDLALGGAPRAGLRGSFLSLEVGKKAKPVSPKLRSRLLRRVGRYLGLGEAKLEPPGAGGGGTPSPGPSPGPGTGPPGPDPAPPPPGPPGPPPPPGPPHHHRRRYHHRPRGAMPWARRSLMSPRSFR